MRLYTLLTLFSICNSLFSNAQVLVKDEPRHQNVFENAAIRVLEVVIHPGDTTMYHVHEIPSLFVTFTSTLIGSQLWGEKPGSASKSNRGSVSYGSFYPNKRVHRVWNADTSLFHVLDIEILASTSDSMSVAIQNPILELSAEEEKVRIYSLNLGSKQQGEIRTAANPVLLVITIGKLAINDFNEASKKIDAGSFHWIKKHHNVKLANIKAQQLEGYAFEIKL